MPSGAFWSGAFLPTAFYTDFRRSLRESPVPYLPSTTRFVFGPDGDLTLALPITPIEFALANVGGDIEADSGVRAAFVVRRDELWTFSLRFYESEWPAVQQMITVLQTGALLRFYPDTLVAPDHWVEGYLRSPALGSRYEATPDPDYPIVQLLTITIAKVGEVIPPIPCVEEVIIGDGMDYAAQEDYEAAWAGANPGELTDGAVRWLSDGDEVGGPTAWGVGAELATHYFTGLTPGRKYTVKFRMNVSDSVNSEPDHAPAAHTFTAGASTSDTERTLIAVAMLKNSLGMGSDDTEDPAIPEDATVYQADTFDPTFQRVGDAFPALDGWKDYEYEATADEAGEIRVQIGKFDGRNYVSDIRIDDVEIWRICEDEPEPDVEDSIHPFRRRIVVNNERLIAGQSLTNFTVHVEDTLAELQSTFYGGHVHEADADDVVFTSDPKGLNLLRYEREMYDPATGTFRWHVKLPSVSAGHPTVFWMHYGKATITTFQGGARGKAWTPHYHGVYHFGQFHEVGSTTNILYDSTEGARNLLWPSILPSSTADGKLGDALSSGVVNIPNLGFDLARGFGIEVWLRTGGSPVTSHDRAVFQLGTLSSGSNPIFTLDGPCMFHWDAIGAFSGRYGTIIHWVGSGPVIARVFHILPYLSEDTRWYHLVIRWNASTGVFGIYLNGEAVYGDYAPDLRGMAGPGFAINPGDPDLDELHIYNETPSASWIKASYHNGFKASDDYADRLITIDDEEAF